MSIKKLLSSILGIIAGYILAFGDPKLMPLSVVLALVAIIIIRFLPDNR